jgi:hypothetical protein
MADAATAPFLMHGAREVLGESAVHIEQQIVALEEAVGTNSGLVFDLARTLLESACKMVLTDRACEYEDGWDLPKLLKETVSRLRLVPDGLDGAPGAEASLRKTVGGLQTVIQGICELRNTHGFASHGKDASFQQLEAVQALLVARAADAIVSFLFRVHRGYPATAPSKRLTYLDHADFNEHVDEANQPVRIFDLSYRPSEVLFQVDAQAYGEYLAGFEAEETPEERPTGARGTKLKP